MPKLQQTEPTASSSVRRAGVWRAGPDRLKGVLTVPILVDGRNLFEPAVARNAGFTYLPTGRPADGL